MIHSPIRRTWIVAAGILAAAGAVVAALRHRGTHHAGRTVPGGVLMKDVVSYDRMSRFLQGSLFRRIADDVAAVAPTGGRVLEVGCGPGHLSIAMASRHELDVTAIDLDPDMIERARANAGNADSDAAQLSFVVGDVASLPFSDGSFDVVVSTFSMHHWADPATGLAEIGRVLRPGARALIWDVRPGGGPRLFARHHHIPDPAELVDGLPLGVTSTSPWRWPWRFSLAQRIELVRD